MVEIAATSQTVTGFLKRASDYLEVPHEKEPTILQNPDLEPIPKNRRIWSFWSFFGYWGIPNIAIWTWLGGSAMLALGLNIGQTMGALTVGNLLICLYTCLNSGPGSTYYIGYTVCQRMIFGIYGSGLGIVIRVILSILLYGSQSWLGGQAMVVLFSTFSGNYLNMKNTFPDSVAMTTRDFIGFLCFQIIQMFFFILKPEKMNTYINISCVFTLISFIGILITCLLKNNGPGPIYYKKVTLLPGETGWMWLYAMTIWYGGLSPDCTNQSDFSRFASNKKMMHFGIISSILTTSTFVSLAGMICASVTEELYGASLWLPTDIALRWMSDNYSPGCRAACFFLGFSFTASQVSFNVLANGFAGGMDLSGICPKYINIRRGAIITALLSWVTQPWTFYNTSSAFLTAMSSFGVFISPIIAMIVADFHIIRRGKIPLLDLYLTLPNGTYYFTKGFNFRALFVWIVAIVPGIPGLAKSVDETVNIPSGLNNYLYGNIIFGFFCPLILYTALCYIFPLKNVGVTDDYDVFNVFTEEECKKLDLIPASSIEVNEGESIIIGIEKEVVKKDVMEKV